MNRFFIVFLFVGMNAKAQTATYADLSNGNNLSIAYQTTTVFKGSISQQGANITNSYATGFPYVANEADRIGEKISANITTTFPQSENGFASFSKYSINDLHGVSGIDPAMINKSSPLSSNTLTTLGTDPNLTLTAWGGLSAAAKTAKLTYTDYVNLPTAKNSLIEFHDHETTTNSGVTVGLTTTYLTANYSNLIPASTTNGAEIDRHGIYQDKVYASGNTPWLVETAPNIGTGTSVVLNTYSNLLLQNNNGAFSINTADGNTFQIATNDKGGVVGWTSLVDKTNLTLSASMVNTPGQLSADGLINSKQGLTVGGITSSSVFISSEAITFVDNNPYLNYNVKDLSINSNGNSKEALVLDTRNSAAISFNATSGVSSIFFEINSSAVAKITADGIIVGSSDSEPSAILTLSSNRQGFLPPILTDNEIFNIPNPKEGLTVYSKEHHTLSCYDGAFWNLCLTRKLKRPRHSSTVL